MRRLNEIIALFILGRDILKGRGLEKHAQVLDAKADALIANLTSRVPNTSDTEWTVTARKPSPAEMRRIHRQLSLHRPRPKRWKCCRPLEKRRTRDGRSLWGAVCVYTMLGGTHKRPGRTGAMWRTVSYGDRKPTAVEIHGHKMPVCRAALPVTTHPTPNQRKP